MSNNEKIVSAAICIDGFIITQPPPARHHNLLRVAHEWGGRELTQNDRALQGFLTNRGRYVDRIEGARIALAAQQLEQTNWGEDLYSEDLW